MELKIQKKKKYTLNSIEVYNKVMSLRRKTGWGDQRIKEYLEKSGICITLGVISGWIYRNKKPFVKRIITQIPEKAKELTEEKAYVLGTLCGDGWLSTGYRIGLNVIDLDFAKYFKKCFEKVYEIKGSITKRLRKPNNYCSK